MKILSLLFLFLFLTGCQNYDEEGFSEYSIHKETKTKVDSAGFDEDELYKDGYDQDGYNVDGYNILGFSKDGIDKEGYDYLGFNNNGLDRDGYNRKGFNKEGYRRSGFNEKGFNKEGYNRRGYNVNGYDREGYNDIGEDKNGKTRRANAGLPDIYENYRFDQASYNRLMKYFASRDDTFEFTCSNGSHKVPYAVDILPGDSHSALINYGKQRCAEESSMWNKLKGTHGRYEFSTNQF